VSWMQGKRNGRRASMSVTHPMARTDDLVVEEVADEVLVYDQRNDQAHCLSSAAGQVWRACDGTMSQDGLAAELKLEPETVARAIEELDSCGLLDTGPETGVTRREVTARMMKVGAVAASAPLIYSVMAPTPALAASEASCFKICPNGCGACNQAGCCCCAPGGGDFKICTIDCPTCQALEKAVPFFHCDNEITSLACSSGC
jgi:hypothetical protein